jgi:tetratricopeptide (TPR) repeat protein
LGYLALAVHQAGAYAFKHPPLSKFLDSFEAEKSKVLEWTPSFWQYKRITDGNTKEQLSNAFITFELSVRNLDVDADIRDNVVQFMTISSYLHTERISEELLKQYSTPSNSCFKIFLNPTGDWDGNKFLRIMVKLRETALVQSFSPEERYFSLHPVVSDWLKCRNQEKEMTEAQRLDRFTASKLVKNYINATVKDLGLMYLGLPYDIRQSVLLHVTACVGNAKAFTELGKTSNEWEEVAHCFADFLDSVGDYTTAQVLQEEVVRRREHKPKDMFSLSIQGVLAKIYHHQGRFEKVDEILKQVEGLSEEALKRGDPDAFTLADIRIRNLAWQEKFNEAEDQVRLLIQAKSKALLAEDRSLLKSRSMLAWILENRATEEKLKEAELLNDEVLNLRRRCFGETDLDTLTSYNAKGVLYHMTGRLWKAEELIRKAATGREEKLGKTHPDTLNVLTNLSMVLAAQNGKIGEAEKLARFVLRSRRERLGEAHISTLVSIANLVLILAKKDPHGDTYSLEMEALKDQLHSLEKHGHPSISNHLEADLKFLRADADARVVPIRGIRNRALGGSFFRILAGTKNRSEVRAPARLSVQLAARNMQSQMQVQQ